MKLVFDCIKFKQCIKTDTEWISNGCSIKIGNYLVECIKKNDIGWYLKAGCHTIYDKEIDLFINCINEITEGLK